MVRSSLRFAFTLTGVVLLVIGPALTSSVAQEPFYKGKRLSMLINFGPGSSTDIEARLFGQHFSKHIDGRPELIMQNMDGAGGLNGGLHLGEIGPNDGTRFGYLTALGWLYATEPERFRVDLKSYEFVGSQSGTAVYFARADAAPGIKDAADIAKAQHLVSGGISARSGRDATIRLTLELLGVPFRHVTGYRSGEHAMLALQRGEIQFYSSTTPGYRARVEPDLVKTGIVTPLYFDPNWDGKKFVVSKQVEGLPILPFQELYRKIKGTMPNGPLWDAYVACITVNGDLQRLVALPPGAPKAALGALRAALLRLNDDSEFAAAAMKVLGFVPEYHAGPDANERVRGALSIRPEIRKFVADYLNRASK
jgi:tripartite-type tricarboxylate transporter receptor subunit TctC